MKKIVLLSAICFAVILVACKKQLSPEEMRKENIAACMKASMASGLDSLNAAMMCSDVFDFLCQKDSAVLQMNQEEFQEFVQENIATLSDIMQHYNRQQ